MAIPYKIVQEPEFSAKIKRLENLFPRTEDFMKGLYNILSYVPLDWGTPIPKEPSQKYGIYFVGESLEVGKFPPFKILYRVTDDCVYLISMGGIIM